MHMFYKLMATGRGKFMRGPGLEAPGFRQVLMEREGRASKQAFLPHLWDTPSLSTPGPQRVGRWLPR